MSALAYLEPEEEDDEPTTFKFDQLDDRAKEAARDWLRDDYPHDGWWDDVFLWVDEIAQVIGFDIKHRHDRLVSGSSVTSPEIYFSGFSCQGDGARFDGTWGPESFPTHALGKLLELAPNDEDLHDIALDVLALAERCNMMFPDASVRITGHRNGSAHSGNTYFEVGLPDHPEDFTDETNLRWIVDMAMCKGLGLTQDAFLDSIREVSRRFMDWIYRQLKAEHDYLTSDAVVDEHMIENEYEFDEYGARI